MCNFQENFVKYAIWMDLRCLFIQLRGKISSEVTSEVTIVTEADKIAINGKMHMDIRVI